MVGRDVEKSKGKGDGESGWVEERDRRVDGRKTNLKT